MTKKHCNCKTRKKNVWYAKNVHPTACDTESLKVERSFDGAIAKCISLNILRTIPTVLYKQAKIWRLRSLKSGKITGKIFTQFTF